MSGVWTEKSVPMTDHECAVEALEGSWRATILASNQNPIQVRVRVEGQEWSDPKISSKVFHPSTTVERRAQPQSLG